MIILLYSFILQVDGFIVVRNKFEIKLEFYKVMPGIFYGNHGSKVTYCSWIASFKLFLIILGQDGYCTGADEESGYGKALAQLVPL